LTAVPKADDLPSNTPLFTVAYKLVKIFDRDLKLAGILKRDESGRTLTFTPCGIASARS